jgi:predicted O-methyltransferase YrrM
VNDAQTSWRAVDEYLVSTLVPEDDALTGARDRGRSAGLPAIEVAPNQGKLLYLLAKAIGASSILEVGTLAGYSTIWLARALPPDGRLITLEAAPEHAAVARENIAGAGLADRVDVIVGPALETLPTLRDRRFDFVFIDADKPNNPHYVEHAIAMANSGALIVVDNVVRGGGVAEPGNEDPSIVGTRACLELMAGNERLEATAIQTVGSKEWDGFAIARVR